MLTSDFPPDLLRRVRRALLQRSVLPIATARNLEEERFLIKKNHIAWRLRLINQGLVQQADLSDIPIKTFSSLTKVYEWLNLQTQERVEELFTRTDSIDIKEQLTSKGYRLSPLGGGALAILRDELQQSWQTIRYEEEDQLVFLPGVAVRRNDGGVEGEFWESVSACLYYQYPLSPPFVFFTDSLILAARNNVLCKFQQYCWCSFYSADDSINSVDLSPLKNLYVVVVIYPHKKKTNLEQLRRGLETGRKLQEGRVRGILYASYIYEKMLTADLPEFVAKEPIFLADDELRTMCSEKNQSSIVVPDWLMPNTVFQRDNKTPLIEWPMLKTSDIVYLLGGSLEARSKLIASLGLSVATGQPILPGSKLPKAYKVLALLSESYFSKITEITELLRQDPFRLCRSSPKLLQYQWLELRNNNDSIFRILPVRNSQSQPADWLNKTTSDFIERTFDELNKQSNLAVKLIVIDELALCGKLSATPGAETAYSEYISSLSQRGIAVLLLGSSSRRRIPADIWRLEAETSYKSGFSFSLNCGPKKPTYGYKFIYKPKPKWQKAKIISLEEQIKIINGLYAQNEKKPFGTGKDHTLTGRDIAERTGFEDSQIKKLRNLSGHAQACPQRGKRNRSLQ